MTNTMVSVHLEIAKTRYFHWLAQRIPPESALKTAIEEATTFVNLYFKDETNE